MKLAANLPGVAVIDWLKRNGALLIGSIGMAVCLAGMAGIFASSRRRELLVWALVVYIAFSALSQGRLYGFISAEYFQRRFGAKDKASALGTHWIMNATLSLLFPISAAYSGVYHLHSRRDDGAATHRCPALLSRDKARPAEKLQRMLKDRVTELAAMHSQSLTDGRP